MFRFLLITIFIPVILGIIIPLIVEFLKPSPKNLKRTIILGSIAAILLGMISYLLTPPFRLIGFNWCQTQTQSVSISGRLVDRYGEGTSGETLQIQIFPAGGDEDSALEKAVFATTSEDGRLSVAIPQSNSWASAEDKYVINFVYWYPGAITGNEQHKKIDFKRGKPFACPQ